MSIQPGRVLARTIEQIAQRAQLEGSGDGSALAWRSASAAREEGLFESTRVPHALASAGYATLLHFWCDALFDFLSRRGEVAQFAGAANWAMCGRIDPPELDAWLDSVGACEPGEALGIVEAYRMIDGSCRASYVARSEQAWLAYFWAHGWSARPLVLPSLPGRP